MGQYLFVLFVGLLAGAISGVIGTGSSIMLLPVLVFTFGPKQAVPIMAVAAVMANISRVIAWWREIDWKAFAVYSITGIPAAAIGAQTLWVLPVHIVDIGLGIFFLVIIPIRHWLDAKKLHIRLWQLSIIGGIIGFLTGLVLSTGPLSVPAFTSYGLMKGAFLSTEAASSLALYISKVVTFRELGALPIELILQGVTVGVSLMLGTFIAKSVVQRMSIVSFKYVLDFLLLCSGISMLWTAFH
ncbi:sulfite exporter TauE/SafE family protein [Paenibacillus radicis (ex Xue et al. 2023)]|uniref:Probable membrane transporter protein n=1 Tax=Paenibacillus radicis (ex Xue et al. 2023) TaxID=2972489 RepID=A0ABT1YB64_9BACL|nr:sulfite exporter TauE/SafE family protein [Paenibacillus radicis (ex Xue et al. 2023)]MCR8630436.1 sulfite exporter TauE/SafE family protein [Paenibacillus radicis (ex Xue et al. 2023)]